MSIHDFESDVSTSPLAKIFKTSAKVGLTASCVGMLPHLLCAPVIAGAVAVSTGIGSGILPQFLPHEASVGVAVGLPILSTLLWAILRIKASDPIEKFIALGAGALSLAFAVSTHIQSADTQNTQNLIARWDATPTDTQQFIKDQIHAGMDCKEAVKMFTIVCLTPPIIKQNQLVGNLPLCLQENLIK